jgi:iron complex outermembrane receptor protein
MHTVLTSFFRRALPLVLFVLAFAVADAADATKVNFNLPAGDAGQTLKQFAAQAKREILFPVQRVDTVKTNAVQGELTVREGLDKLLAGTELRAIEDAKTGALVVQRADDPNAPRAAQKDSDRPTSQGKVEDGKLVLDKFEVFGSKSLNLDLPRTRDDAQPYVVFDHETIANSQATNLSDFFRTRLPMNAAQSFGPYSQANTIGNTLNLRGLGANQTLILVDGRRVPGIATGGPATGQPDLNGIPLSMIERVEVLPSTASGIYGGSATGGVINIITRKDFAGAVLTLSYANTFDTDSAQSKAELMVTTKLRGGATMITLTASDLTANPIVTGDRDFAQRARNLAFANNPTAFTGTSRVPTGATPNIRSSNGANLVLKSGTALNSPITFIPVGYAGTGTDGGAALVANAGRYNLALANSWDGRLSRLTSTPSQRSLGLGLRQKITPWLEAYADALWTRNRGGSGTIGTTTTTVAATAPNNPFTSAIIVAYPNVGLVNNGYSQVTSSRLTGGLVAKLPGEWQAGLDYTWGRSRLVFHSAGLVFGDPDGPTGSGLSYATARSTGVLDVLRDLNVRALDYSPYLMPNNVYDSGGSALTQSAALRASGPVYRLPAGDVVLSGALTWQKDENESVVSPSPLTATPGFSYLWFPAVSADQRAAYTELRLPLLAPATRDSKQARLELQLAGRYDDSRVKSYGQNDLPSVTSMDGPFPAFAYNHLNLSATSWTAGLRYVPLPDLTLRASVGTGFLSPSANQLNPAFTSFSSITVTDPKRGNISNTYDVTYNTSGNPNLKPEYSKSVSAGVIFTPRFWPGFRLSVDYTKINKTDEITGLVDQQTFIYEDALPGLIVRDALTSADRALGYTAGIPTTVNAIPVNFAKRVAEAVDVQADYTRKTSIGEFRLFAVATFNLGFDSQITPDSPRIEQVGYLNGPMKWRGNAGLDWTRGRWSAGWNAYYFNEQYIYAAETIPASIASAVLTQGSDIYAAQLYHEMRVGYQFGYGDSGWQRFLKNTRLNVGVQNVFNREPPIRAGTGIGGGFLPTEDPRLRRYTLSLRKQF